MGKLPRLSRERLENLEHLLEVPVTNLYTYVVSSATSQEVMQRVLHNFLSWHEPEVLLLVVDMQEISKEVINHTRILMEESEANCIIPCSKLMILLLHFPPNMFSQSSYPSLYLNGWEHYYLDSVGQMQSDCSTDVERWLLQCCSHSNTAGKFSSTNSSNSDVSHDGSKLSKAQPTSFITREGMTVWLRQLLRILPATIYSQSSGASSTAYWEQLLFDYGVGDVVMDRYLSYWKPQQMSELSEVAAYRSVNYESTISISGGIEAALRNSFTEFTLYILKLITVHRVTNLEDDRVHSVFIMILYSIPIPETSQQLHVELFTLLNKPFKKTTNLKPQKPPPLFPFFKLIYKLMESVLDSAMKEVHQSMSSELRQETNDIEEAENLGISSNNNDERIRGAMKRLIESMNVSFLPKLSCCVHVYMQTTIILCK